MLDKLEKAASIFMTAAFIIGSLFFEVILGCKCDKMENGPLVTGQFWWALRRDTEIKLTIAYLRAITFFCFDGHISNYAPLSPSLFTLSSSPRSTIVSLPVPHTVPGSMCASLNNAKIFKKVDKFTRFNSFLKISWFLEALNNTINEIVFCFNNKPICE